MGAIMTKKRRVLWAAGLVVVLALAVSPSPAQADTLTYNMTFVFSGATPDSSSPYATAQFRDGTSCDPDCGAGTVQLVLTSSLEASAEFITEWDFNTTILGISVVYDGASGLNSGTYTAPGIFVVTNGTGNQYQADGDGIYDFSFQFVSAQAGRFNGTDVAVFTITGTGITVSTFDSLAAPGGGAGPFKSAMHVQGIQPNCSGWVSNQSGATSGAVGPCGAVPEPSTLLLLGSGLASIGLFWGRKKVMSM